MSRHSTTYSEALRLAHRLYSEGTSPTPTRVREMLGRGSYSTIGKALQEWRETVGTTTAPRASSSSGPFVATSAPQLPKNVPNQAPPSLDAEALAQDIARLLLPALTALLPKTSQNSTSAEDILKALELMASRLDGVQRHMLMSVEQARSETLHWKQRAQELKEEMGTWRLTYQQRHDADRAEIQRLRDHVAHLMRTRE